MSSPGLSLWYNVIVRLLPIWLGGMLPMVPAIVLLGLAIAAWKRRDDFGCINYSVSGLVVASCVSIVVWQLRVHPGPQWRLTAGLVVVFLPVLALVIGLGSVKIGQILRRKIRSSEGLHRWQKLTTLLALTLYMMFYAGSTWLSLWGGQDRLPLHLQTIVQSTSTHPDELRAAYELLSREDTIGSSMTLALLARNPQTPTDVLDALSKWPSETVVAQMALLGNPKVSTESLERAVQRVSTYLAQHPEVRWREHGQIQLESARKELERRQGK